HDRHGAAAGLGAGLGRAPTRRRPEGVRPRAARRLPDARPGDGGRRRGVDPLHHDRRRGLHRPRGGADPRPRGGRQPAGEDGHPRGRPQLGPDRLGRGLRRDPLRGDPALALDQRRLRVRARDAHELRRRSPLRRPPRQPRGPPPPALRPGPGRDPLLDLRPHGRVRASECGLHDL
ncbi:hypothetical protein HK102_010259, partial [Quaeritorhiza haematococci]